MPDYDLYNGGIVRKRITAERAHQLYEEAAANPDADLDGDLETGFHYWTKFEGTLELVRHHVIPRQDDDEPPGLSLPSGNP